MRILFTLMFTSLFMGLSAQTLSLSEIEVDLPIGEYIDYGVIRVTNNGQEAVNLALTLEKICLESGDATAIQICVGDVCFSPVSKTTTWGVTDDPDDVLIKLEPGEASTALKFDPFFDEADYGSEWNVVFFEIEKPENKATLNVKLGGECTPVSTTNLVQLDQSAFPNPAAGFINIPYKGFESANQLMIYNSIGAVQELITLNASINENILLDLGDYSKGVYFYQFTDGQEVSKAKAFVKE